MIQREEWYMILEQHAKAVYQKDIADQLGVHPKTVSRALKRNGPPKGRKKQVKP